MPGCHGVSDSARLPCAWAARLEIDSKNMAEKAAPLRIMGPSFFETGL